MNDIPYVYRYMFVWKGWRGGMLLIYIIFSSKILSNCKYMKTNIRHKPYISLHVFTLSI